MKRPSVLRTPERRFNNLDGYPWPPHYLDIFDTELGTLRQTFPHIVWRQ